MTFDKLILGGTLVTSTTTEQADIGITEGKIAAIGDLSQASAAEVINAKGLHVFAGIIDTQVHFREPGLTHKEDLESGTRAAIAGGVTTIFEMPNTNPNTTTRETLEDKLQRANGRAWSNYAFFVGAASDNLQQLPELEVLPGTPGIKIFMGSSTGTLLVPDDETVFKVLTAGRFRCSVHSEDHFRLESRKALQAGSPSAHSHPIWRDEECAKLCTQRLISLAEKAKRPVHVLHISSADELPVLANAKKRGVDVTCEVTPQHLWFAGPEAYDKHGTFMQMNPPVRNERNRSAVRQALKDGLFDVFGSDHAPHTIQEKLQPYPKSPSGMPGVQTLAPVLLTLMKELGLSLNQFAKMASEKSAEIFGIANKGRLEVGMDADIAILDLGEARTPNLEPGTITSMQSKCGWTPYLNEKLIGWPRFTLLAGNVVWRDGELLGTPSGKPVQFIR